MIDPGAYPCYLLLLVSRFLHRQISIVTTGLDVTDSKLLYT